MFRAFAICTFFHAWTSGDASDQTAVTSNLNRLIARSPGQVYGGGKGVIFRNVNDDITDKAVVPGSLIVNDIVAANIAYPNGDPFCPTLGWDGYTKGNACNSDPYLNAVVGIVIGNNMNQLFKDFDNIQNADWGWGVFYGTDSNSVDHRCAWVNKSSGWNCPGRFIDSHGNAKDDPNQKGAGSFGPGNPLANLGGGGAGCHYNMAGKGIDQFDSDAQPNLVGDYWCQCNYDLKGNGWQDWVDQWIQHGKPKPGYEWMGWFKDGTTKAPMWALDEGICWVNNPRDMIYMQNMIWFHRWDWSNQLMPQSYWNINLPETQRYYWGWNEVPLDVHVVQNPQNWDAIVIKLPVAICGGIGGDDSIACMPVDAKTDLETQLTWHVQHGYLKLGQQYMNQRPGSYVVFLREWQQAPNYWQRWFFCENYQGEKYSVHFQPQQNGNNGQCFADGGGGKPPQPAKCDGQQGSISVKRDTNMCLDIAGGKIVNGAEVQIWNCNGLSQQHFVWCSDFRIVTASDTSMCLDIPGGVPGYATYLQLWECNGRESQKWSWDSNTESIYSTQSGETMCVDLANGKTDPGTRVNIYQCQPGSGERWSLVSPPPMLCYGQVGLFRPYGNLGVCLDIKGGKPYNGAQVLLWNCDGQKQQQWLWCRDNRITSALDDNYCLDIPGDTRKATVLQVWQCTGGENQRWGYDGQHRSIYPTTVKETMCVGALGGHLHAGSQVGLFPCQHGHGQPWILGMTMSNLQATNESSFIDLIV